MVELIHGDLLKADVDALVNTVNCVGVMGKGVALQFKKAYPENFKKYQSACKNGDVRPGQMFVFSTNKLFGVKYIINIPTKDHWKTSSKIEYIQKGLDSLVSAIREKNISSIAIPPLGCGNGGLDWELIRPLIQERLSVLEPSVRVLLYEPSGAPVTQETIRTTAPALTIFKAAIIRLVSRYICWEDSLTRLEIQKLCYFQKEAGDTAFKRLIFKTGKYGPYAGSLGHAMQDMDGHYLCNCGDNENPLREIWPAPGADEKAAKIIEEQSPATLRCLSKVFQLIDGFETPAGMELLATVHWVAHYYDPPADNPQKAYEYVHEWNEHKAMAFKQKQIDIAWNRLKSLGWI